MMNVPEELREFMGTTPRGNHNNTFVQHADDNTDEDDGDEEDDDVGAWGGSCRGGRGSGVGETVGEREGV